jgi:hypothetical protein
MHGIASIPPDPRWSYDDPSGLPDEIPVTVRLPERLLAAVQAVASRSGTTPSAWVLDLIARSVEA